MEVQRSPAGPLAHSPQTLTLLHQLNTTELLLLDPHISKRSKVQEDKASHVSTEQSGSGLVGWLHSVLPLLNIMDGLVPRGPLEHPESSRPLCSDVAYRFLLLQQLSASPPAAVSQLKLVSLL